MGLLVFLLLLVMPLPAFCVETPAPPPVEVIYDPGNPDNSVGIIGEELFELGSLYEEEKVVSFTADRIVFKDPLSEDSLVQVKDGRVSSKTRLRARRLFIVKQMRAIYQAQIDYVEKLQGPFAGEINPLIDQGFLYDGFKDGQKEGYKFSILQAGYAKRLAFQFKAEPYFLAVAEPLNPEKDPWFFSVDHLGLVRYSKSLRSVSWGPVWEYNGLNEVLPSTVISHDGEGASGS